MRVVDVDSHYFEPPDWLSQVDPALAAEISPGDPIERVVRFVVGDLLDVVPRDQLPERSRPPPPHPRLGQKRDMTTQGATYPPTSASSASLVLAAS